ncbi:hypothetical protein KAJ27_04665 [bacterium]|nr:hypothetical protein [bacterium]
MIRKYRGKDNNISTIHGLLMTITVVLMMVFFLPYTLFANDKATPSDVYSEVIQIKKELYIIQNFFNIDQNAEFREIKKTELTPRHSWQKTYEIMVKINILRRANNLPIVEPANMEPVLNLNPILTYEQTQRVLTELRIIKFRLGIFEKVTAPDFFTKKVPMDVFNKLREVSAILDVINGSEFTPSYVFGESMRIYQDINNILNRLGIRDTSIPPDKLPKSTPKEAMLTLLHLLKKISELESGIGVEGVDPSVFYIDKPLPEDVFELALIVLSELQVIKASLGISHDITQSARYYTQKTPADVNQLLGWALLKMNQINTLR